mmetsp:Transcript_101495/g.262366  ORF Transcript_101495/g.262366 Transcript_101495/m.262366 type:complete len:327 (+) Transcript_101495:156-1136(+)
MAEGEVDEEDDLRRIEAARRAPRRAAVAAEGLSHEEVRDYVKPVYPKDPATHEGLRAIIRGDDKMQVLFGHLDDAALDHVINAFYEVEGYQGQDVIVQGHEGDCLYIVGEGSADVYVARPGLDGHYAPGDRGALVCCLGPGHLFGELALMYSAPRAATVNISSPVCRLWRLDREPFKMLLAQQGQSQYQLYQGWLSEVFLFKMLNRYELSKVSELLESTPYDPGEVIVEQGELGDRLFILEDGSCAAFMRGPEGELMVKEYLRQGDYFGEIALLNSEPRKATVRATGNGALVLSITQEDFTSVLGPIQDILKKDIHNYPEYASFLH